MHTSLYLTLLIALRLPMAGPDKPAPAFDRDILPVLSDFCFPCHGPDAKSRKADLRLDTAADALRHDSGIIVPGKPAESAVIERMRHADPSKLMPPPKFAKRPTEAQIKALESWIASGAKWGQHWSLIPPQKPTLPTAATTWPRQPWDALVLDRLTKEGLKPAPQAPKAMLLRRVTLDLTGLPPTPKELVDFLADGAPGAYDRAVDRLLASPRYGERMAWEWLDAARYADSNGYQGDAERTMWPWRDWVVQAFNKNLPYNQFTIWQVAGDLLPAATHEQKLATGFLRNYMINGEGGRIPEENRVDYVFDMAETVGTVWLGLTFNCCRCHDHKYDPLTNKDYYSLFAFFNRTSVDGSGGNPQTPPILDTPSPIQASERIRLADLLKGVQATIDALEKEFAPQVDPASEAGKALKKKLADRSATESLAIRKALKEFAKQYGPTLDEHEKFKAARDANERIIPRVMVMADQPKFRDTFLLKTGLYNQPADKVDAATPSALPPLPAGAPVDRLALARWLMAAENPLTARVTVNRLWTQFFGMGLVKTPEDFGIQGERPPMPELLDYLAIDFRDSGWDVKRLVRSIVTSATYCQASTVTPELLEKDPENRLLARGPRNRLPASMLRDQALAVSGLLVDKTGGRPVNPYQPEGIWEEATFGNKKYSQDKGDALYRRTLYTFWRRIVGPAEVFDNAPRQVCSVKVYRTNTPLHALLTLNDPTYIEAARHLAQIALQSPGDETARLQVLANRVLGRPLTPTEIPTLAKALAVSRSQYKNAPEDAEKLLKVGESERDEDLPAEEHAAWTVIAQIVLNLDETLCKE